MDQHEESFQDQFFFHFDLSCTKLRKAEHEDGRTTRSTMEYIDSDLGNALAKPLSYKMLSHYVVEDVMASQVGPRFLLCIVMDLDEHHGNVPSKATQLKM